MKKTILLIAALSLAILVKSQNTEYAFLRYKYFWGYFDISYGAKDQKEKFVKAGVSGYSETFKNKKDEYLKSKVTYDKNGSTTSNTYFRKNGKVSASYQYEYNSSDLLTLQVHKNGKGKEKQRLTVTYDQLKNALEEAYYKNGKLKAKTVSSYDSTRILECDFYKDGSSQCSKKWIYAYYPDKTKKSSVIYNAKGKILYAWNYECKPEGELVSKHKDTTDVCKKVEYDEAGNKTVTVRKFNAKGKAYKLVMVYDKNEKIMQYLSYNNKDQLTYSYKYESGTQNISEATYYKNGKVTYTYKNTYDSNNNLTGSVSFRKGKEVNRSVYAYNDNNLLASRTWYRKKDKLYDSMTYQYVFF